MISPADTAICATGQPSDAILRYAQAISGLAGRDGTRNATSKYEAVALTLIEPEGTGAGRIYRPFPALDSPLNIETFFPTIYKHYDLRFVYQAPALEAITRRVEWAADSPALAQSIGPEYQARILAE
jgi:hypothetical protein